MAFSFGGIICLSHVFKECAKFRGSRAIMSLVGLVPSCHRFFVGISWVQNFFSWVFHGFNIFLVGISWVSNFFSWVFRGSKIFLVGTSNFQNVSRGYFLGPKFFLMSISWVQFFSFGWLRDSKIFSSYLHEQEWQKQKYENTSQTTYSFLNRFQQLSIVYIGKLLHLLNYRIS